MLLVNGLPKTARKRLLQNLLKLLAFIAEWLAAFRWLFKQVPSRLLPQ
jgi:hypothetical protein